MRERRPSHEKNPGAAGPGIPDADAVRLRYLTDSHHPVSYTHLDVYKRQALIIIMILAVIYIAIINENFLKAASIIKEAVEALS